MGLNLNDKKAVVAEVSAQGSQRPDDRDCRIPWHRGYRPHRAAQKARESGVYLRVLKTPWCVARLPAPRLPAWLTKMVGPLIYSISADPVAAAKVLLNDFAKPTTSWYSGRFLCRQGARQSWCSGACVRPEPRRAAVQAAVRHAGSGVRLCPRPGCALAKKREEAALPP